MYYDNLSVKFKDYREAYMCVPNVTFSLVRIIVSVLLDTCRYKNHEIYSFSHINVFMTVKLSPNDAKIRWLIL